MKFRLLSSQIFANTRIINLRRFSQKNIKNMEFASQLYINGKWVNILTQDFYKLII